MKKSERGITMLQLVIIGFIIVIIAVTCKTLIGREKNTENIEISAEQSEAFDKWNGVYVQGNNAITLIRIGMNKIRVIMSKYNSGIEIASQTLELNSDSKLVYNGKEEFEIEKTQAGLKCTILKEKSDSEISGFDGEYEIQSFSKLGWDGVYKNGNYMIIIAELEEQRLNVIVNSNLEVWETEIEEYTEDEFKYNADLMGSAKYLHIAKEGEEIKVEASSNNKDSVLNKIDGIFSK